MSEFGNEIDRLSISISVENVEQLHNLSQSIQLLEKSINSLKTSLIGLESINTFTNSLKKLDSIDITKYATTFKDLGVEDLSHFTGQINQLVPAVERLVTASNGLQNLSKIKGILPRGNTPNINSGEGFNFSELINPFKSLNGLLGIFNTNINTSTNSSKDLFDVHIRGLVHTYYLWESMVNIFRTFSEAMTIVIQKSASYSENLNLLNISFRELAPNMQEFIDRLVTSFHIDPTQLFQYTGEIQNLTTSLGIASQQASIITKNVTALALDYASALNVTADVAFQKFESGLAGQTKALRAWGLDVSNAKIQQVALEQGIQGPIARLDQATKAQLRYIAMLEQSKNIQGDMANTLQSEANELKTLNQQWSVLLRTIGDLFQPILVAVLPYVIAFVEYLSKATEALAVFLGFRIQTFPINYLGAVNDGLDTTANNADKASKALTKMLAGFDQLTIIGATRGTSLGGLDTGGIGSNLKLPEYDPFAKLNPAFQNEIDAIKKKLDNFFKGVGEFFKPTVDAFNQLKTDLATPVLALKVLFDLFKNDVLDPITNWVGNTALPTFFHGLDDIVKGIDWFNIVVGFSTLFLALQPFGQAVGQGLIDFYIDFIVPLTQWAGNVLLPEFLNDTASAFKAVDWNYISQAFDNLFKSLVPFGEAIGQGLVDFYNNLLLPISTWVIGTALPDFLNQFARALESVNWKEYNKSLADIWTAISRFATQNLGVGLLWFLDNIIIPMAKTLAQHVIPDALKLIAFSLTQLDNAFGSFNSNKGTGVFFKLFIEGALVTTLTGAKLAIYGLVDAVRLLTDNFLIVTSVANIFLDKITFHNSVYHNSLLQSSLDSLKSDLKDINTQSKDIDKTITDTINNFKNVPQAIGPFKSSGVSLPLLPNIKHYASGGFPSVGEVFTSNESGPELVGKIGSQNAVANTSQIVDSIAKGVSNAMGLHIDRLISAFSNNKSGNQTIQLNLDGTMITKTVINGINATTRKTGATPLLFQ